MRTNTQDEADPEILCQKKQNHPADELDTKYHQIV
jgi:hypothetical protein